MSEAAEIPDTTHMVDNEVVNVCDIIGGDSVIQSVYVGAVGLATGKAFCVSAVCISGFPVSTTSRREGKKMI